MTLYNPSAGSRLVSKGYTSGQVAMMRTIPRLCDVAEKYGSPLLHKWIEIQLLSIDTLQGQVSFTPESKSEATTLICAKYLKLNIAELLNFFTRYKLGEFNHIYGGGLQKVLTALHHYCTMRDDDIIRIYRNSEKVQREKELKRQQEKAITYDEYLQQRNCE